MVTYSDAGVGCTTERRKARLSRRPGRRRVLDRSERVLCRRFRGEKMSTDRALLSVNRGAS